MNAPGGLPLRVRIDEARRDPFEFVALRTTNLKQAVAHYEGLGMRAVDVKSGKKKVQFSINSNTIFENEDATEPDRESGSYLMAYGEREANTGVLLLPPTSKKVRDPSPPVMQFVGTPAAPAAAPGPDGVRTAFIPLGQFESQLLTGRFTGPKVGLMADEELGLVAPTSLMAPASD